MLPYVLFHRQKTSGYEAHISAMHTAFERYRDEIISKWDTKLRLASGKLTNKVGLTTEVVGTNLYSLFAGFCSSRSINPGTNKTCESLLLYNSSKP